MKNKINVNAILSRSFRKNHETFNWEKENRIAEEDVKAGRIKKFSNKSEAMKWLKS